jgi:hypothetical protein
MLMRGIFKALRGRAVPLALIVAIRKRRVTFVIFLFCSILLGHLGFSIRNYFRVERRNVEFGFLGKAIRTAGIYITHRETADEVHLEFVALAAPNLPQDERRFSIWVPAGFQEKAVYCQGAHPDGSVVREGMRWYLFQAEKEGERVCQIEALAQVMTSSALETDLTLNVLSLGKPDFPVTMVISGLDRLDIAELSHSPSSRYTGSIQYNPLPVENPNFFDEVSMHIRDRERGIRSEFKIFWMGMVFGVFSSFTASILYDIAREWETNLERERRPPLIVP